MKIAEFQKALLSWFKKNKRDLPFRDSKDPYKIWLSEIMAQQTTMPVVVGYFKRFIKKFPSVESVARAKEQDVLVLWQGLGYYARARNFKRACEAVVKDCNGKIPTNSIELKKLKGIGDYTAAAISSICFNEEKAVIDGNVKRVIARLFAYKKEINSKAAIKFFEQKAFELLDKKKSGTFNEAMMELGALVCDKKPKCQICPVKKWCLAKDNNPETYPVKKRTEYKQKIYASLILHSNKSLLLKQPSKDSLVSGLWELPSLYDLKTVPKFSQWQKLLGGQLNNDKPKKIDQLKHAITNKKIQALVYKSRQNASVLTKLSVGGFKAVRLNELEKFPVNTLSRKMIQRYFYE